MDEFMMFLFVVGIPVLVIVWWIRMFLLVKNTVEGIIRELDRTLPTLQKELQNYPHLSRTQQQARAGQITGLIARANADMRQLDEMHRARYEMRVEELQSMAANAGIDWSPGSY